MGTNVSTGESIPESKEAQHLAQPQRLGFLLFRLSTILMQTKISLSLALNLLILEALEVETKEVCSAISGNRLF